MIRPFPKPPFSHPKPKRLPKRPVRMTLIGAIKCPEGVVLLADGQETIPDYAKWAVNKIKSAEINQSLRVAVAGAGDSNTIDMIWEKVSPLWGGTGSDWMTGWIAGIAERTPTEWRRLIVEETWKVVRECVVPWGDSYPSAGLIWIVQDISEKGRSSGRPFEVFRTCNLSENTISRCFFDGNPVLLATYLSDLYLKNSIWGLEEARAFAAYLLWEAKEYDPTVGKQSDIIALWPDGRASRMSYEEVSYWEDHFRILKREMGVLPIFSCATSSTRQSYEQQDRLGRFQLALKTLTNEQEKMRAGKRRHQRLDGIVTPKIRKHATKSMNRAKKEAATPSDVQRSEPGP